MPRQRRSSDRIQLNVWITREAKQHLDDRYQREGCYYAEQIETFIQRDIARAGGERAEQQSLPLIRKIVEATVREQIAQLRADLRCDLRHEIIEPIKTLSRSSDDRLAALITRTVRDSGILRRLLFTLIDKLFGKEFARQAYADARSRPVADQATAAPAEKEKEAE